MPKTYTDDIGQVLPSALEGPFQVSDPADADNYLKIDPANARIEAAGSARPTRHLTVLHDSEYGAPLKTTLGTAIVARTLVATTDNGFYTKPFHLPHDIDVTQTSDVKIIIATASSLGSGIVRLELITSYCKDGDTSVANQTVTYDWPTPGGWTPEHPKLVTIDNGSGYTYQPNTWESGDIIGLAIRRLGSAAQDTYIQNVIVPIGVLFAYTAKQI